MPWLVKPPVQQDARTRFPVADFWVSEHMVVEIRPRARPETKQAPSELLFTMETSKRFLGIASPSSNQPGTFASLSNPTSLPVPEALGWYGSRMSEMIA
ncbi:hypothetical protein ACJZ2D_010400 [Fusarium nematophilum]